MIKPLEFTPIISRRRLEALEHQQKSDRIFTVISYIYILISFAATCSCAGLGIRMLLEHL